MNNFAEYILNEKDLISKLEIAYYLSKKSKIFFDKSVVFKVEIARLFLNYMKLNVDDNQVLTAVILCNCKKVDNPQDIGKLKTYAKEGAEYLETLGFDKKFCKMCEEINRYSNSNPREKESDILELVDQFGGMLLDRPERIGFKPDEALVLLEHRNLKDVYNRYLESFDEFVKSIEQIQMVQTTSMSALSRLTKMHNETQDVKQFISKVVYEFEPKIDELIGEKREEIKNEMFQQAESNRALFSEATAKKVLCHLSEKPVEQTGNEE